MSLSKIALFAFGLAVVLTSGLSQSDAASRRSHWSTNSYVSEADEARFDRAKGYPQGY